MCKWNENCKYKSDETCHDCEYNYINTEEEMKHYLGFTESLDDTKGGSA